MKYGIIDIGSNTMRLNLYSVENGEINSLLNKKNVAGLATYVKKGQMTKKGADKLIKILNKFENICEAFDIKNIYAFATAALRNAKNSDDVMEYVRENSNIPIDLLSGEEEANLGYLGIQEDYDFDNGYILDIGGGSVEVTTVKNRKVIYSTSMTEGHLSLFRENVVSILPKKEEIKKMKKEIKKLIEQENIETIKNTNIIYGTGGTIRACGNVAQEVFDLPTNSTLHKDTIDKLYKNLKKQDKKTMRTVLQVVPERVHTITPGIIILREILKYTNSETIKISKKGVREGYLLKVINKGD